ncbi:MAG: hypothetical protein ACK56I_01810, partial [bacterium]
MPNRARAVRLGTRADSRLGSRGSRAPELSAGARCDLAGDVEVVDIAVGAVVLLPAGGQRGGEGLLGDPEGARVAGRVDAQVQGHLRHLRRAGLA